MVGETTQGRGRRWTGLPVDHSQLEEVEDEAQRTSVGAAPLCQAENFPSALPCFPVVGQKKHSSASAHSFKVRFSTSGFARLVAHRVEFFLLVFLVLVFCCVSTSCSYGLSYHPLRSWDENAPTPGNEKPYALLDGDEHASFLVFGQSLPPPDYCRSFRTCRRGLATQLSRISDHASRLSTRRRYSWSSRYTVLFAKAAAQGRLISQVAHQLCRAAQPTNRLHGAFVGRTQLP